MKVVSLAFFYLGSVCFFGVEPARLDIASDFKRKWSRWALGRVKREATLTGAEADAHVQIREVRDEHSAHEEEGHSHQKRQDPNVFLHTHRRLACRMGTCSLGKLADQLFHLNDKKKDPNAPAKKIGPHGYGRRRRSLWDLTEHNSSSNSRVVSRRLASLPFLARP